jgi:predicted ATPase
MEIHRNSGGSGRKPSEVSTTAWYAAPVTGSESPRGGGGFDPRLRAPGAPADLEEDLFGDGEDERTVAIPAVYDLRTRFTGRRPVLERLVALFDTAVRERAMGFALVEADPGMGKSRLVSELAKACRDKQPGVRFLVGAADDGGGPFAAFARLFGQRFGVAHGAPIADSRERVIAGVADVVPPARVTEVAHLIAHLMRIGFEDSPVVGPLVESPRQLESRTFLAIRRFLAADAEQRPLVLVLENLELAGPETINLVQYLAAGMRGSQVLLVATAQASTPASARATSPPRS